MLVQCVALTLTNDMYGQILSLKLSSLFVAWPFWTFHTKSHNMKGLVILSHSWSPFRPLTCLYEKKTFVCLCAAFRSIFLRKNSSQIIHANHITMTTCWQILSWSDYRKTKENVNITFVRHVFVHILLSTCQWVYMALAINRPYIPLCKIVMGNFYKIFLV